MSVTVHKECLSHQGMVVSILQTANALDATISQVLGQYDITHPQFNILRILESASPAPISVKCIKERILFTKSDITRLIDRLVDKNLVSRKLCPDNRRKMDIVLTKAGQEKIDKILPALEERLQGYFSEVVSEEEKEVLNKSLISIRKAI